MGWRDGKETGGDGKGSGGVKGQVEIGKRVGRDSWRWRGGERDIGKVGVAKKMGGDGRMEMGRVGVGDWDKGTGGDGKGGVEKWKVTGGDGKGVKRWKGRQVEI